MLQLILMNDSTVIFAQEGGARPPEWLVLIHQIPPKPDYFRVKVRRRLQRIGAVALKNSVYVLPRRAETREDFEWLVREIRAEGGEATLCRGALLAGTSDEEVGPCSNPSGHPTTPRSREDARALAGRRPIRRGEWTGCVAGWRRPSGSTSSTRRAGRRRTAAGRVASPATDGRRGSGGRRADRRGATWVTRTGVKVDRISSAWLIRRFIDPAARFKFVPAKGYQPEPGELRFDMYQGEFTHEGDRCTFETLLARFGLGEPAPSGARRDRSRRGLKDEKFGRPEAPGIASLIDGLVVAYPDDAERLERGAAVFEGMYAYISVRGAVAPRGMTLVGGCMSKRILGPLAVAALVLTSSAWAQGATAKEPVADGRTLSEWVADLKAHAPADAERRGLRDLGDGPGGRARRARADRGARRLRGRRCGSPSRWRWPRSVRRPRPRSRSSRR